MATQSWVTLQVYQSKKLVQEMQAHLPAVTEVKLLKDAWECLRGGYQKHTCLSGVKQTAIRQPQTVGLPQNGCKWVQFVALTAISLECI